MLDTVKFFPVFIAYLVSYIILNRVDSKYFIIKKLDSRIKDKIKIAKTPIFYIVSALLVNFILIYIGVFILKLTNPLYTIFIGCIMAIGCVMDKFENPKEEL